MQLLFTKHRNVFLLLVSTLIGTTRTLIWEQPLTLFPRIKKPKLDCDETEILKSIFRASFLSFLLNHLKKSQRETNFVKQNNPRWDLLQFTLIGLPLPFLSKQNSSLSQYHFFSNLLSQALYYLDYLCRLYTHVRSAFTCKCECVCVCFVCVCGCNSENSN